MKSSFKSFNSKLGIIIKGGRNRNRNNEYQLYIDNKSYFIIYNNKKYYLTIDNITKRNKNLFMKIDKKYIKIIF